jgi:hypothetical protein
MKKKIDPEPLAPNADTIDAIKAARRGDQATVSAPENLIRALLDNANHTNDGGVSNDAAHEKIIAPELGGGDDAVKLAALRAAAKIGTDALERGDFEEFENAVELAAHLLKTT